MDLNGKIALVTGAGRGIGQQIAVTLAEYGATVIVNDNGSKEKAEETVKEIEETGHKAEAIQCNVAEFDSARELIDRIAKSYGRLDILVNNAGICPRASALEYTEEMWDNIIQVNQKSVFFLSQMAARQFVRQGGGGKIINLASMMSYLGGINTAAYTASKSAVMGMTRLMASEWGSLGINVNAIAPGWIKTDLSSAVYNDPQRNANILSRIPQGDWGEPDSFKGIAVLLASDAGSYINGATIPVDGGYLTK